MAKEKVKRLIVNADDFGMHESINRSVEDAHRRGVLTSASLVVNTQNFDEAVEIAKRNKTLGVGIHLTLIDEEPVAPKEKIPSILDKDGRLFKVFATEFCMKVIKGESKLTHVAEECEAQILKFIRSGLVPTHVDSHQQLHLFPPIFNCLKPILKKYGIKNVRTLNVPWSDYRRAEILRIGVALFAKLARLWQGPEYKSPDYYFGFFNSGNINTDYFKEILSKLKAGTAEISLHPGTDNALIRKRYIFWEEHSGWKADWEKEYGILLDPEIKNIIDKEGISLIDYSKL